MSVFVSNQKNQQQVSVAETSTREAGIRVFFVVGICSNFNSGSDFNVGPPFIVRPCVMCSGAPFSRILHKAHCREVLFNFSTLDPFKGRGPNHPL